MVYELCGVLCVGKVFFYNSNMWSMWCVRGLCVCLVHVLHKRHMAKKPPHKF